MIVAPTPPSAQWDKGQLHLLKKALKDFPAQNFADDKNERFRCIARTVGGGRTKKECYDKYKELKADKKARVREQECGGTRPAKLDERPRAMPAPTQPNGALHKAAAAAAAATAAAAAVTAQGDILLQRRVSAALTVPTELSGCAEERSTGSDGDGGGGGGGGSGGRAWHDQRQASELPEELEWDVSFTPAAEPPCTPSATLAMAAGHGGCTRPESPLEVMEVEEFHADDADSDEGQPGARAAPLRAPVRAAAAPPPAAAAPPMTRISRADATALRQLLFGDAKRCFPPSWAQQGLTFSTRAGLRYGLVQHRGGPCGPLAVVQALLLAHLVHGGSADDEPARADGDKGAAPTATATSAGAADWRFPTRRQQHDAVLEAVAHVLWQARDAAHGCVVALPRSNDDVGGSGGAFRPGLPTDSLELHALRNRPSLVRFIAGHMRAFTEEKGLGVVLLVCSAVLTRGLASVRSDADSGLGDAATLIGRHDYASQELVNLLMTGRAYPHVFDGERALGDTAAATAAAAAPPPPLLLRGVPARGHVGFLTLFEAYGHVSVGARYKRPAVPVWVVCSESHYSALFACDGAAAGAGAGDAAAHKFDLFYYDPLGQQDETIRLSVDTRPRALPPGPDAAAAGALVPPLDLVVRTRWPGAAVDWNGTDPIL